VIFDFVVSQRMDQDVQPLTVKHQPRHKIGREGFFSKDYLPLGDRMRPCDPSKLGPARLASELPDQPIMQGYRGGLGRIVIIDVDMIAV